MLENNYFRGEPLSEARNLYYAVRFFATSWMALDEELAAGFVLRDASVRSPAGAGGARARAACKRASATWSREAVHANEVKPL